MDRFGLSPINCHREPPLDLFPMVRHIFVYNSFIFYFKHLPALAASVHLRIFLDAQGSLSFSLAAHFEEVPLTFFDALLTFLFNRARSSPPKAIFDMKREF